MGRGIQSGAGIDSYKAGDYTTYSALCEIIDNSIQAKAKNIHIIVAEEKAISPSGKNIKLISDIIIYDDGCGISKDIMDICLVHGGSDRLNADEGLGKFGHGLPEASCTQADRTNVYSWQNSNDAYRTYFDFDELRPQTDPRLPDTEKVELAKELLHPIKTIIKNGNFSQFNSESGTIIHWKMADRHDHKTIAAFFRNFEFEIGRIYRYFIQRGLNITLTGFERINKSFVVHKKEDYRYHTVRPNDPMFLMEKSLVGDYHDGLKNKPTNVIYGTEINHITLNGKKYSVKLKFSYFDNKVRKMLKPADAGGTPLGEKLYRPMTGISLLREDRELKLDTYGFIKDVSVPTNRFWSVEVNFSAQLDSLFGVTKNKQRANAFRKITKKEYLEDLQLTENESLDLMYKISREITDNIKAMKDILSKQTEGTRSKIKVKCPRCGKKTFLDNKCGSCGYIPKFCNKHEDIELNDDGKCGICILDDNNQNYCTKHMVKYLGKYCEKCDKERKEGEETLSEENEKRLRSYLKDNFSDYSESPKLLDDAINYVKNVSRNQLIIYTNSDAGTFFSHESFGEILIIEINKKHPFYDRFIKKIVDDNTRNLEEIIPINLLIGAFVTAEIDNYEDKEIISDFRRSFGLNLMKIMRYYSFPES
jgi:hypothetical protein